MGLRMTLAFYPQTRFMSSFPLKESRVVLASVKLSAKLHVRFLCSHSSTESPTGGRLAHTHSSSLIAELVPGSLLPLLRSCCSPFENTQWRKVKQMQPMQVCIQQPSKPMRVCVQQPSRQSDSSSLPPLPSCCSSPKHSISNLLKCHRHFFMKYINQS